SECNVCQKVKGVICAADLVGAAFSHVDEMGDEIAADLRRIDEMRHAEALAPGFLFRIEIDANDHVGADEAKALDDVQSYAAQPEHDALGAGLDLRGVDHGADAGRHAAADVAHLVEWRVFADFGNGDFRQNRKIDEGRTTRVGVKFHPAPR